MGYSAKIFNCDMRCIHSLETIFGYAGSSITDYPRCSLQLKFRIRQWHWQHAASSMLSFLLSIIANRLVMALTSVAFYLETLHSAFQGDCQWQALVLLFHLFGSLHWRMVRGDNLRSKKLKKACWRHTAYKYCSRISSCRACAWSIMYNYRYPDFYASLVQRMMRSARLGLLCHEAGYRSSWLALTIAVNFRKIP